jgi:LDH2 family malate/lactate/ureidoglycolate dehydrogenase
MPNVPANKLIEIAKALLIATGASKEEATVTARYDIGANLAGHDSHGIILVPTSGGALLPPGGTEGSKGTGLAAIVEILSGLLTGLGFGVEPTGWHNDGCFMAVLNVSAFRRLETFKQEVTEFAQYLKATPSAQGFTGVYYPGEIGFCNEQDRRKNGVPLEDATWNKIPELAQAYGLAGKPGITA